MNETKEVLTAKEAAEWLGMTHSSAERTVERMARTGILKGFKPSNKVGWRFHVDALRDKLVLGR